MGILSTSLWPSAFTTILAAVSALTGLYITHVVEELRSGYTASYGIEKASNGLHHFHLENLSRAKAIDAADFYIMCENRQPNCFSTLPNTTKNGAPSFAELGSTAPTFARPLTNYSSSREIRVCIGAVASSRTTIEFNPTDPQSKLIVMYDPWSEESECRSTDPEAMNLFLMKSGDLHAIVVRHFFSFLTAALGLSLVGLLIAGLMALRRKPKEIENDPEPEKRSILLVVDSRNRKRRRV